MEKSPGVKEVKAKNTKKTLRRFSGQVFMLPDAQRRCGFVESNEANATLALVQDLPFSAAYHGSLGLCDHVTFAVRRGPAGLEAVDLEGALTISGAVRLEFWTPLLLVQLVFCRKSWIL